MSGSPKYTTVVFAAQRRAQLEAARRLREAERRQREESARRQRIEAALQSARSRAEAMTARVGDLMRTSGGLPQHAEVTRESSTVAGAAAGLARITDEAGVAVWNKQLREAERRADRLSAAVATELTAREHGAALAMTLAELDGVPDRARFDPPGERTVGELTAEARSRLGDARFAEVHRRLGTAAGEHLERVRDRQALVQRLAAESAEVATRLTAALADAEPAGVQIPEADAMRKALTELGEEYDGAHVTRWEDRLAALRRHVDTVTATVEARLDQLDRMAIIVEAAGTALPMAGLQVVADSLVERDDAIVFHARRSDGADIELTVHAGDGRGSRLEYRTDGRDVVVEPAADGPVSRCDLTADILERFHTELGHQGMQADGLHWEGKPDDIPPTIGKEEARPALSERSQG
jgi:hypothetical protein